MAKAGRITAKPRTHARTPKPQNRKRKPKMNIYIYTHAYPYIHVWHPTCQIKFPRENFKTKFQNRKRKLKLNIYSYTHTNIKNRQRNKQKLKNKPAKGAKTNTHTHTHTHTHTLQAANSKQQTRKLQNSKGQTTNSKAPPPTHKDRGPPSQPQPANPKTGVEASSGPFSQHMRAQDAKPITARARQISKTRPTNKDIRKQKAKHKEQAT